MIVGNYLICFIVNQGKVTVANVLHNGSDIHYHLSKFILNAFK